MKKFIIKNKNFDGLIVTSPGITNKYAYDVYSRNMVGWQEDVSRYFTGWFPIFGPCFFRNEYNIKIIKNYENL